MKREEAYKTLELEDGATESEIKKAFRSLAAKNHPDQNKDDPKAEARFKTVNEAYQILTGKQKAENENAFDYNDNSPSNINDIFNEIFNNGGRPNNIQVHDTVVNLSLTFEESVFGVNKSFSYNVKVGCSDCGGNGINSMKTSRCQKCGGSGHLTIREKMGAFFRTINFPCNFCNGRGFSGDPCKKCSGVGMSDKEKKVSLNIPPLGNALKKFFIRAQGNEFDNVIGNVIIMVRPTGKKDEMFIDGRNIISTVEIGLDKLLFGGKEKVRTVHGVKEIDIKKMTSPGSTISIKGCGVAGGQDTYKTKEFEQGNHTVVVQAKYPKKEKLTEELKDILEKTYK